MTNLIEFKVSKTIFDDVKNDPQFRIGFEAEFHVENASHLLRDERGLLPQDFEGFNVGIPDLNQTSNFTQGWEDNGTYDVDHESTTLYRVGQLLGQHLGIAIEISNPGYKSGYDQWKLTSDASVVDPQRPDDLGVELVSPILSLRDGLAWLAKVCEMIATFEHGPIRLYTSIRTGLHVNLSHALMANGFDYAKLAILGGDQHYLSDFKRLGNQYAMPILKAVHDLLVGIRDRKRGDEDQIHAALDLLRLRNWNADKVMKNLSALVPMDHHMSIDFRRLTTPNPYIEIRVAGNARYEQRYDDIARMAIRYGALIKIACEPTAYRDEYLKKVYQLVSSTAPPAPPPNPMPKIKIYLQPVMSRASRAALNQIDVHKASYSQTPLSNASYLVLTILRSAIDMRLAQTLRTREGMNMLLTVVGLKTADLMRALNDPMMLMRYGIMRQTENKGQTIAMLTNAIKSLSQPVPKRTLMASAIDNRESMLEEQIKLRLKRKLREKEFERKRKELKEQEASRMTGLQPITTFS